MSNGWIFESELRLKGSAQKSNDGVGFTQNYLQARGGDKSPLLTLFGK